MSQSALLRYKDEKDKCYGVTGMAISVFVFDAEKYISSVSIDENDIDCIRFTPDYYVSCGSNMSARAAWNMLVDRFQCVSGLVIGNMLCRRVVKDNVDLSREHYDAMLDLLTEEGGLECELDKEEVRTLFNKNYQYLYRVFHHEAIRSIADHFSEVLSQRRSLSRSDVMELLAELSH